MKQYLFTLFLFFNICAIAQVKPYSYLVNTGLNDHVITSLSKDQYGRLILGTNKGVFSYNGFKSKQLDAGNLKNSDFIEIIEVGSRCFGLNKQGQLVEIELNSFHIIPETNFQGPIRLIKSEKGKLIVIDEKSIYVCSVAPFKIIEKINVPFLDRGKNQILDYARSKQGRFVLLSSNELVDLDDNSARVVPNLKSRWLLSSPKGILILPSKVNNQNAFLFHQSRFTNLRRINTSITKSIERVVQSGNSAYICTEGAMFAYDLATLKVQFQLPGYSIADIMQEKSGTLWLATKRKGLLCLPSGNYDLVSAGDFMNLYQLPGMNEFLGLDVNGKLLSLNQQGKKSRELFPQKTNFYEFGVHEVDGVSGLSSQGALLSFAKSWRLVPYSEKLVGLYPLADGSFLTTGNNGMKQIFVRNIEDLGKKKVKSTTFFKEQVRESVEIDDNQFVVLTSNGLFSFERNSGEMKEIRYYNEEIGAIALFSFQGKAAMLTKNNLLLIYDGKRITQERDLKEVNPDIKIQKVRVVDDYLYLLSDNSLYRSKGIHGNLERLDQLSRMNGVYLRDFVVLKDNLFIATQFGLYKFTWEKQNITIPVFLAGSAIGNEETTVKGGVKKFAHENTTVKIPFEIVELGELHPFQLQYRLVRDGKLKDSTWTNYSVYLNHLNFEYLDGGNYCVHLRLKDPFSKTVSKVQKRYFIIEYHWTEHHWIWFVFGIFSTIVVGTYIRNREMKRKFKQAAKNS